MKATVERLIHLTAPDGTEGIQLLFKHEDGSRSISKVLAVGGPGLAFTAKYLRSIGYTEDYLDYSIVGRQLELVL